MYAVSQVIQQSHLIWITLVLWDGRHSCFGIQSVLYFPGLFLLCPLPPHLRHRQFHASSRNILCVGYNVECYLDVQFTSKQCKCRGLFPLAWVNQWSSWQKLALYLTDPYPLSMPITDPMNWLSNWTLLSCCQCSCRQSLGQWPAAVCGVGEAKLCQVARSCSVSGGGCSACDAIHGCPWAVELRKT